MPKLRSVALRWLHPQLSLPSQQGLVPQYLSLYQTRMCLLRLLEGIQPSKTQLEITGAEADYSKTANRSAEYGGR
jgi:hypothetical protein